MKNENRWMNEHQSSFTLEGAASTRKNNSRAQNQNNRRKYSRALGTAPAVDDVVLCSRKSDEAGYIEKGYERLEPQLKAVGLGKVRRPLDFGNG